MQKVLEYNPISTLASVNSVFKADADAVLMTQSTAPRANSKATAMLWHRRLGHLGREALEHLDAETEGAKLIGPRTINCETCSVSKAHQLISRRPRERATRPYDRLHMDLIHMETAYNGMKYLLHFVDDCTRMQHPYATNTKSGATLTYAIFGFIALIERQIGYQVRTLHTDGAYLGEAFERQRTELGLNVVISPPYTAEQNGSAERSGRVLIEKARSMALEANLLADMWPEAVLTAAYLANRSPTRILDWLTPLGLVRQRMIESNRDVSQLSKPILNHLRVFGCRAYVLRKAQKDTKKLPKLDPRALIGYLVGYESTNVWKVWIPAEKRVICTRDVTFDETRLYDLTERQSYDPLRTAPPIVEVEPEAEKSDEDEVVF